jgi:hypothetical protein
VNILRFDMNVPMEVALQSAEGVAIEGRYGTRMMFSLADGRVMYVPPIVATKIKAEGILPGERFDLCKAAVKTGKKGSVEWLLERIDPGQAREGVANGMAPDAPESPLEHDLRVSAEMATANKAGLRPEPAPCTHVEEIPPFAPLDEPHLGNNGNNGDNSAQTNGPSAPTTKLEQALKTAISAAHNAEKFGSELGYVVRFDADAIKAMAITVLINMSERVAR